ncbi:hypothetical protein BKA93DRAFT_289752 [Sparassis latifolia]
MAEQRTSDVEPLCRIYSSSLLEVRSMLEFKRVPRNRLERFCMDLCLVALSVRTGYLFDAFSLSDMVTPPVEMLVQIIAAMRQVSPAFESVIAIHDPTFDQLFFVNMNLLRFRCGQSVSKSESEQTYAYLDGWTSFVHLLQPPQLMPVAPARVQDLALELCHVSGLDGELPVSTMLSASHPPGIPDIVSLAAVLLEYPVAYVPASMEETSFLAGVRLDVYHCTLSWSHADHRPSGFISTEHTLLKFSCPSIIGDANADLSVRQLVERLQTRFDPRLRQAGFSGTLRIIHTVETLDRVAL